MLLVFPNTLVIAAKMRLKIDNFTSDEYTREDFRGVAQLASALGLGPRGRRFESSHPDQDSLSEHLA